MDPLSDVCSFLEAKDLKPGQVRLGFAKATIQ